WGVEVAAAAHPGRWIRDPTEPSRVPAGDWVLHAAGGLLPTAALCWLRGALRLHCASSRAGRLPKPSQGRMRPGIACNFSIRARPPPRRPDSGLGQGVRAPETTRGASQEFASPLVVAELGHRNAAQGACWRVVLRATRLSAPSGSPAASKRAAEATRES